MFHTRKTTIDDIKKQKRTEQQFLNTKKMQHAINLSIRQRLIVVEQMTVQEAQQKLDENMSS